jgi:hypothetical protein
LINPNLDHVGIVVPELERAMGALSAHLGLEWAGIFTPTISIHDSERGTRDVSLTIAVSKQRPYLELIQPIPDSPWASDGDRMLLHHIAYFAEDLGADSARLSGPCPIEAAGVGADGQMPKTFTYQHCDGLRFEFLERRTQALPTS